MSSHRQGHRHGNRRRLRRSRSVRLRALLALGVVACVGVTGTFAYWTDDVPITGTTLTAGTLDLQGSNGTTPGTFGDSVATTTLGMSNMVPGSTSAEIITMKNSGTAPLKYTLTGGLTGTDAAAFSTAGILKVTISTGATKSGSGNTATCTGGTTVVSTTALTATTTTPLIGTRRGPLAATSTEALCFQITFDASAASTFQGKTATATFTATGTSDVS